MPVDEFDVDDGKVPFADRRFSPDRMIEVVAPPDLARLIEHEISRNGIVVPTDDFLEIRCASEHFATAVFMIKRAPNGNLKLLVPDGAARKPN